MENKLQELTQKLYNEGVEKANTEAEKIIADAKSEADKLKQVAEKDAQKIIADAEQKSVEIKKNVDASLLTYYSYLKSTALIIFNIQEFYHAN